MIDVPRPEHPRPDFERKAWQNLNGEWEFAIGATRPGIEFPLRIIVPFCPESKLSGLGHTDFMEAVWYRRKFCLDEALQGKRILLHFGAVDYEAQVWVNGKDVVHHKGGYTPFSADITDTLNTHGENELVVYVIDNIRSDCQPSGKQSHQLHSYGCMYTRTTGIWQAVWLEAVSETHISGLTVWPDAANARVSLEVSIEKPKSGIRLEVSASSDGKIIVLQDLKPTNIITLEIPNPILWQPGKPHLYDLRLRLLDGIKAVDEVSSYFGLRDVRIEGDRILINGEPIFQRLILDQGFWPDGIYTAPSDTELKADIERAIKLGFNGARLHQKIFEPRALYWADKMGYLIWAEFPDWGCSIRTHVQARENFLREWADAVLRDRSHPSIVAWTPLNEAHSNADRYNPLFLREVYDLTKRLDPSRPVVDASGYTHVKTDIWDLHDYDQNAESFKARYDSFGIDPRTETLPRNDGDHEPPYDGQPVVMSEYGGIWWNPGQQNEEAWGYGDRPSDEETFIERLTGLTNTLLDNPHITGLCYTQLTDVEQEVNGLYTYDRIAKFPQEEVRRILSKKAAIET